MADRLKIFNASAGSGKTYTLVLEYLRIVLNSDRDDKFNRILAMTFTNKAANEMKERILKALTDLGTPFHEKNGEQIKYLNDIVEKLKLDPEVVEKRSAGILNKMLHHYHGFSVMTIDKFTHRIIRTFARDLNLSMDFDVELDLDSLRNEVTDMLFDQIGRDKTLTGLMVNYVNTQLAEDKSWDFNDQLSEFSKELFKENAINSIEKLQELSAEDFGRIRNDLVTHNKKIENAISSVAQEAVDVARSNGLDAADFYKGRYSVMAYFEKVASGNIQPPTEAVQRYVNEGNWAKKTGRNATLVESLSDIFEQYFRQLEEIIDKGYNKVLLNNEILRNLNNLSLLNHLLKIINEVKEEENILLISDFYRRIAEVIIEEPVPFIYERLGVRYEHFLLDEFQDTSKLQWVNLVPLLENSLSSGHQNLIVGDGKQAIYRWRNGEVEQFTRLPEELYNPENVPALTEASYKFIEEGKRYRLEKNYRSKEEIVVFNNNFFKQISTCLPENLRYIYEEVEQEVTKKGQGYLEFNVDPELNDEAQIQFVKTAVRKALNSGFEQRDICVLSRNNKKGSYIATELAEEKYKVISADSLFLGKDSAVKFIISACHALQHPKDRNYKLKALEHFSLLILNWDPKAFQDEVGMKNIERLSFSELADQKGFNIKKATDFINLFEFIEELIQCFDLDIKNNPYLQFLLEQVHLFEKRKNSSLLDFLEWYDDTGYESTITYPEGSDAIKVMTIHKAKGLQFPVVICPFVDWKMDVSDQSAWLGGETEELPTYYLKMTQKIEKGPHSKEYQEEYGKFLLDNINLLYVAFTRAETALFVCARPWKGNSPAKKWLLPFLESQDDCEDGKHMIRGELVFDRGKEVTTVKSMDLRYAQKIMGKPKLSYRQIEADLSIPIERKREFGKMLHFILSKTVRREDLEEVIEKCIRKGMFEAEDGADYHKVATELFEDPTFQKYYAEENVLNEKAIIDAEGDKHVPDKIIRFPDHTLVVEFKTGSASEEHKRQVRRYMHLLKEMGENNVRGEVYYTETKVVLEV